MNFVFSADDRVKAAMDHQNLMAQHGRTVRAASGNSGDSISMNECILLYISMARSKHAGMFRKKHEPKASCFASFFTFTNIPIPGVWIKPSKHGEHQKNNCFIK